MKCIFLQTHWIVTRGYLRGPEKVRVETNLNYAWKLLKILAIGYHSCFCCSSIEIKIFCLVSTRGWYWTKIFQVGIFENWILVTQYCLAQDWKRFSSASTLEKKGSTTSFVSLLQMATIVLYLSSGANFGVKIVNWCTWIHIF